MASLVGVNGWKWGERRKLVLARDARRCQLRLPVCRIDATEVDHILPRALGGNDDLDNLRSVCHPCHLARGMDESRSSPSRFSISGVVTRSYTRTDAG